MTTYFALSGHVMLQDGPWQVRLAPIQCDQPMAGSNDNRPHYDIGGALGGIVIRNAKGRVVYGPTTLSIAARKLTELEAAS